MNRSLAGWMVRPGVVLLVMLAQVSCASAQVSEPPATNPPLPPGAVTFAVIGDYGVGYESETAVAQLVKRWHPDFVVTTGDDYYSAAGGGDSTQYDSSTGKDYCPFLAGITTTGQSCPQPGPSAANRFFPALGNHDYSDAGTTHGTPTTYTHYFDLPGAGMANTSGNERYYDFVKGPVHFFVLNSNPEEPDGTSAIGVQGAWLHDQLAVSKSHWNIVIDHHPPYSSDSQHGSSGYMRWPYAAWGAQVVLSGHAHTYERVEPGDGVVYFVNGLGGASRYPFSTPVNGSQARFDDAWGAQRVTVTATTLRFEFITVDGVIRDRYELPTKPPASLHVSDLQRTSALTLLGWTFSA